MLLDFVQKMLDKAQLAEQNPDKEARAKGIGSFVEFMVQQASFSHEQVSTIFIFYFILGSGSSTQQNHFLYPSSKHEKRKNKKASENLINLFID
jgi:hypothetical protein